MESDDRFQRYIVGLVALIAALAAIADATGLTSHVHWLSGHIDDLVLFVVALIGGIIARSNVVISRHSDDLEALQHNLARITDLYRSDTTVVRVIASEENLFVAMAELLRTSCTRAVLVQPASTLALGPEASAPYEAGFYHALMEAIDKGVRFDHAFSFPALVSNLQSPTRVYSNGDDQPSRLAPNSDNQACIQGKLGLIPLRELPAGSATQPSPGLFVQTSYGTSEGIIINYNGGVPCAIHLRGLAVEELIKTYGSIVASYPYVKWSDYANTVETARASLIRSLAQDYQAPSATPEQASQDLISRGKQQPISAERGNILDTDSGRLVTHRWYRSRVVPDIAEWDHKPEDESNELSSKVT